ncbi:MAG: hypothetical protein KDE01_02420, partial [Caldilineaceae bacterium]|nr:hypothetical protein [Caldilineaceae bacterium]
AFVLFPQEDRRQVYQRAIKESISRRVKRKNKRQDDLTPRRKEHKGVRPNGRCGANHEAK